MTEIKFDTNLATLLVTIVISLATGTATGVTMLIRFQVAQAENKATMAAIEKRLSRVEDSYVRRESHVTTLDDLRRQMEILNRN